MYIRIKNTLLNRLNLQKMLGNTIMASLYDRYIMHTIDEHIDFIDTHHVFIPSDIHEEDSVFYVPYDECKFEIIPVEIDLITGNKKYRFGERPIENNYNDNTMNIAHRNGILISTSLDYLMLGSMLYNRLFRLHKIDINILHHYMTYILGQLPIYKYVGVIIVDIMSSDINSMIESISKYASCIPDNASVDETLLYYALIYFINYKYERRQYDY